MNVFITKKEKEKLKNWEYRIIDNSITTKILNPIYNALVFIIPNSVAPNILSLVGLVCAIYAWYINYNYLEYYPTLIPLITCVLIFLHMCFCAIDGKHARNTHNESQLGEIIDHICTQVGLTFILSAFCYSIGIPDPSLQWFIGQSAHLAYMSKYINGYLNKIVIYGRYTGSGELTVFFIFTIIFNIVHPFSDMCINTGWNRFLFLYGMYFMWSVYITISMKNHIATRNSILIALFVRLIPGILIYTGLKTPSIYTIISDGVIISLLTGDLVLAKMVDRELHALIPVALMISVLSSHLCIALTGIYYIIVLYDMSKYLRIPLFTPHCNVFCNGVFDLCHEGHMNLFKNAAAYGTRLIVGIMNDVDVMSYKRKPKMSHAERCNAVKKQKYVDRVIGHAELYISEDFIKEYNIHVVVCSSEYDDPEDKYYAVPRRLGILKVLPRTDSISTTELIKRCSE